MADKSKEYIVESVIRARVESRRGKKISWKYFVSWKGYGSSHDTWEPPQSFEGGSEHIVEKFWERANTNGRDVNDGRLFTKGEEFFPVGPPRGQKQMKRPKPEATPGHDLDNVPASSTNKRPRSVGPEEEKPLAKRKRIPSAKAAQMQIVLKNGRTNRGTNTTRHENNSSGPSRRSQNIKRQLSPEGSEDPIILGDPVDPSDILLMETVEVEQLIGDERMRRGDEPDSGQLLSHASSPADELLFSNDDNTSHIVDGGAVNLSSQTLSVSVPNSPASTLPSHRARVTNPRVKIIDQPNAGGGIDSAISVKARLSATSASTDRLTAGSSARTLESPSSGSPRIKRGRGRPPKSLQSRPNSLLVFQKGALTTLKGKFRSDQKEVTSVAMTDYDDIDAEGEDDPEVGADYQSLQPMPPPTGQELLKMAGLDASTAETLPDYEDEKITDEQNTQSTSRSLMNAEQNGPAKERDSLLPTAQAPSAGENLTPIWTRPTIFGPLGLGSDTCHKPPLVESSDTTPTRPPFFLSLDSSVSIPIIFKDIYPPSSLGPLAKGPPGKFYKEGSSSALLDTLKMGGPSARIVLDPSVDDSQSEHFDRFRARLEAGEMFIAMSGVELFAFCSSENKVIGQRLQVSPVLLGIAETAIVSRVAIENYSAYADAAVHADPVRW